jgi:hypothetical protein
VVQKLGYKFASKNPQNSVGAFLYSATGKKHFKKGERKVLSEITHYRITHEIVLFRRKSMFAHSASERLAAILPRVKVQLVC